MFSRFTTAARDVVVDAQAQARRLQHREIRAEHLLLAVLADGSSAGSHVLRELGVERERLVEEVSTLGRADDEALRAIGVDLAAVRERVEAAFGPGALDRPRRRRAGLLRRVVTVSGDHLPFTDPAKRALEQSLRAALALGHRDIRTDHVLLGLLSTDDDPAARTLRRLGADPAVVRARVVEQLPRAA